MDCDGNDFSRRYSYGNSQTLLDKRCDRWSRYSRFSWHCFCVLSHLYAAWLQKLHPIPVSLIQFFTIFVLTSLILILLPTEWLGVRVDDPLGFVFGGIILGALTLVGYLTNNFGVRFMGAARASIIASSGPVMTAFLAWLLIQSPLQWIQVLGILLVTGGVTALSFERMKGQPQPAKPTTSS